MVNYVLGDRVLQKYRACVIDVLRLGMDMCGGVCVLCTWDILFFSAFSPWYQPYIQLWIFITHCMMTYRYVYIYTCILLSKESLLHHQGCGKGGLGRGGGRALSPPSFICYLRKDSSKKLHVYTHYMMQKYLQCMSSCVGGSKSTATHYFSDKYALGHSHYINFVCQLPVLKIFICVRSCGNQSSALA